MNAVPAGTRSGGRVLVVTGTGTEVGKTVATAAVAAVASARGQRVAVLKPAQTGVAPGEAGDADEVARLVPGVTPVELARYPDPLAPASAARRAGAEELSVAAVADVSERLRGTHDLVLVEGAGGLLVRLNGAGGTLADVAVALACPVLLVCRAGLGTLNDTALSAEALTARGLRCAGVLVGSWPADPGLAERCNLGELPGVAGAPLVGVLPEGAAGLVPEEFARVSRASLATALGVPR
ncbi:dethiobiotin synthetase [Lipingzhangella halophila]|uniref:ATP-dependent dethiobiotin synthetase BioD n=1 Tax=Lipingzhangella halophila TaxID=1783352 RepID=A0A7W7RDV8_9ACTN|nr:dethiobiotin synthase [Lipingzhangella halophila]MBB4930186.1 dethiobiotin synthetase [Lipingzhangella halophila]